MQGHPVITGVFMNEFIFYGKTNPSSGDSEYDHIVPLLAVESISNDPNTYYGSDIITFSDNGLYTPDDEAVYLFSYTFDEFTKTREGANAKLGNVYSITNSGKNYGISISGVIDLNGDTIPVRCTTDVNREDPEIKDGTSVAPKPGRITLTATVTIPDSTQAYNLYLYDSFDNVPTSTFNALASQASMKWAIPQGTGETFSVSVQILSNQTAVFRAVNVNAP